MRTPCGLAFEDKHVEGRAIVRVHILDPATPVTSSQALMSFWPYGDVRAGNITNGIKYCKHAYKNIFYICPAYNRVKLKLINDL